MSWTNNGLSFEYCALWLSHWCWAISTLFRETLLFSVCMGIHDVTTYIYCSPLRLRVSVVPTLYSANELAAISFTVLFACVGGNTDIFSHQILLQAIQLRLCSLPSLILQGQSEINLEIGLSVFLSGGQVARPFVKV